MGSYERELRRGAFFNALGLVAKALEPLFVLFATWLFGPEVMGVYLVAFFLSELAAGAISTGFADATTVFASHEVDHAGSDPEASRRLHAVVANALLWTLGASLAAAALTQLFAEPLVRVAFPEHGALLPGLYWVGWSLVPFAFAQVAIAATKAHMRMEYDALLSAVRPVTMIGFALLAWSAGGGATELLAAHLASWVVSALVAAVAFARHHDLSALASALRRPTPHRRMLAFAVPQSLNLTLNRYITRLDALMLAAMGFGAVQVAWYGTAALLTSNLKQIRLVFSGALAPIAARHHAAGERDALESALGRLSRSSMRIAVPAVLAAVVLRDDVLSLVDEAYSGDSLFIALLLLPPLGSCAYGLAGNCLVYTGHTRWTLLNSLTVAALNTVLNLLLIPRLGLTGAALATVIATSLVTALQMIELRALEGIAIRWRDVGRPHLGLAAAVVVLVVLWDPASLPHLGARLAVALLLSAVFVAVAVPLPALRPAAPARGAAPPTRRGSDS